MSGRHEQEVARTPLGCTVDLGLNLEDFPDAQVGLGLTLTDLCSGMFYSLRSTATR